jgi:hypothetical protein
VEAKPLRRLMLPHQGEMLLVNRLQRHLRESVDIA